MTPKAPYKSGLAEAEPVEKGKQLLIAEAAIGQDGDATARRQQFRQALQAGVLVGTALVLEFVLPDAQPEQRRCPAMAGDRAQHQRHLIVEAEIGPAAAIC